MVGVAAGAARATSVKARTAMAARAEAKRMLLDFCGIFWFETKEKTQGKT
jgi:hypothetical protein